MDSSFRRNDDGKYVDLGSTWTGDGSRISRESGRDLHRSYGMTGS